MRPGERVAACLAAIARDDARLKAFVVVTAEDARRAAQAAEERLAAGRPLGPLDGLVFAVKDNIDVAGLPTTGGIAHYRGTLAASDAPVVARLRAAGAVLIGKTNLHEAALGATSDNPWFGRVDHPARPGFTPGGSSGGSAAAVAAGMCDFALGTDTMGSVRIPASYCGIAGFKPSVGALSIEGVMPLSPRLDHVGLLARRVATLADAFGVLCPSVRPAGHARNANRLADITAAIGVDDIDAAVTRMMDDARGCLGRAGFEIVSGVLPGWDRERLRRDCFVLSEVDAARVHAAGMAADAGGFSPALRGMLEFGARQTPEKVAALLTRIEAAQRAVDALFDDCAAAMLPTMAHGAFAHGATVPLNQADYTVPANVAGAPAMSLPWGSDARGMPLGLQLLARRGDDHALLALARRVEAARPDDSRAAPVP